ncbi:insulinase family protein [uncultured Ilyobacter sp.]|uniref:M16 family metallopeptidase n=1 Tax=uncultured Ilyobacter sp. TaxID=544433 RepID=UPI002AA6C533|nr:insulinase family protein [uncultured Ilyobacter sp.]
MKKMKIFITTLLLVVVTGLNAADLKVSGELEQGKLKNGMKYYIYKNKKPEDKAYLSLIVNAGSLQEDEDQLGMAHFIEHMAFNGTKSYPGNMLVKHLQSIGMNFGADLNAFTGFDRTIYKLQVPTDRTEEFEKSFEVLKEWANDITFFSKDTIDERGVILEEWRLRQGLSQRISDAQKKAVYGKSRYTERFPIGDPDIIKNATPELLKRYYHKWYHPKNMAVVAVGDFDKNHVKALLEKYFDYDSNYEFKESPKYRIGKSNGEITVFTDPEITSITFDILTKESLEPIQDRESYKRAIIDEIYAGLLQSRFDSISKKADPTIGKGYSYPVDLGKYDSVQVTGAMLREKEIESGISEVIRQMKKLSVYGPTSWEIDGEKSELLMFMENAYKNRESREHSDIASEIEADYLEGYIFTDIENEAEVFREIIKEISYKDILEKAKEVYENSNKAFFLTAPQKKNLHIPTKDEIKKIIENTKNKKLLEVGKNSKKPVLRVKNFSEGEITDKIQETDFLRYKLSNNMEVIIKETDFDKDKILIKLFSKGGSSLMDEKAYIASKLALPVILSSGIGNLSPVETDIYMKGKNIQFHPYISDYTEGIDMETDRENLVTALKILNIFLTQPKVDKDIYENFIVLQKQYINNRKNSPKTLYRDKIKEIVSSNHPRRKPLTLEDLNKISEKDLIEAFRDRFSGIGDFQAVIVGSTRDMDMENLMQKYLAGIPSKDISESPKNLDVKFPKEVTRENVKKGTDKKVSVNLIYPYKGKYTYENRVKYLGVAKILDMILLEEIREKIGGIYTIYADTELSPLNFGENYLTISYSTDPKKADMVTQEIKKVLKNALEGNFEDRILKSVVENYAFNYDSILKKNEFWIDYISKREGFGDNFRIFSPEKYKKTLNRENMIKFMNYAVDSENYIEVRLIPEKSE